MFIFNAGKEAMKLSLIMSWQNIFWQHFQKKKTLGNRSSEH